MMGRETLNLFPNEQVLEAICQWSNSLKQLHQRLGKYYKRSEARGAAFDYIQALLSTVEHLDDGAGILAIDETCFLKKGQESLLCC